MPPVAPLRAMPNLVLLLQRSNDDSNVVANDAATWAAASSNLTIGSVVRLGRHTPAAAAAWLAAVSPAPVRVADPECWTRSDQLGELDQRLSQAWTYLSSTRGAPGSAEEANWLKQVIAAQIDAGATVLLSPGLFTGPADTLQTEIDLATRMATLAPAGWLLMVNFALAREWVEDPALRASLCTRLAKIELSGVYLRLRLPSYTESYTEPRRHQMKKNGYLPGLAQVCDASAASGIKLWLPNTGLTGWVMNARGATGVGTGTSWGQRVWLEPGGGPRGAGRYCERSLLHTVRHDMHESLSRLPGYRQCACAPCRMLHNPGYRGVYQYEQAGRHYLGVVHDQMSASAALAPTARKSAALGVVRACIAERDRLERLDRFALSGNRPHHLPMWESLLS